MDYQLSETRDPPEIMVGIYRDLQTAIATDPAICRDVTPSGLSLSSSNAIPFNEAYMWAAMRGILLICADLGTHVRRVLTTILTISQVPWCIVLGTSALAEGTNMCNLRTVIILGQHYDKPKTVPFYKAGQMIGRGDREDIEGITFAPAVT
jgi:hypothetical protein